MNTKWVIGRYPHGVMLNPMEFVLDKANNVMVFESPGKALDFYVKIGGSVSDINQGIYIEREKDLLKED